MQILKIALLSVFVSQNAFSLRHQHPKICTRDINPWGHPSKCSCPQQNYRYNPRIGLCVHQDDQNEKQVTLVGVLRTQVMAIGGETTGTTLLTDNGTFDIILSRSRMERMNVKALDGKNVSVTGYVTTLTGVEIKERKAIIVMGIKDI